MVSKNQQLFFFCYFQILLHYVFIVPHFTIESADNNVILSIQQHFFNAINIMVLYNTNVYRLRVDSYPSKLLPLLYNADLHSNVMVLLEVRVQLSSVAHNGNTWRLMVARGALYLAVDCQIIDNIPKPTRSCASAWHRARAIRIAERNRKRRLLSWPRWRDPQQRNTTIDTLLAFSHSCTPTRTFIGPRSAHLHMHRRVG